jgi:hypothetical protein
MNGQPFRIGELQRQLDENRAHLASLPQLKLYVPPPPPALTPDQPEWLLEQLRQRMQRDLRHPSRQVIDNGWASLQADAVARFGRKVTVDPWNIADPSARAALERARAAEDDYLSIAMSVPPPSKPVLDHALSVFTAAVASFLNAATRGWPSAAAKAAADAHRARVW